MATLAGSGTQAATVTTEHTLLDIALPGVYQFSVDKINMADLDGVELRIYMIILTGGTRRVVMFDAFYDAQPSDDMIALFDPVMNDLSDAGSLRFTLKQTIGTSRNFPWKVTMA